VRRGLPGLDDPQARYLEAWVDAGDQGFRVASIYLPNGNPIGAEKFAYKLDWMERLIAHARALLASEAAIVLGGDYNVIPEERDCHDPKAWAGDALFQPESRAAFRRLTHLGYTEAFRALHDEPHAYSFWDYQGRAFERDAGIRIDHLLVSPQAADRLTGCQIDKAARAEPHASDHVPVWCELGPAERF
jgi:exodeoxyribonuclease-3